MENFEHRRELRRALDEFKVIEVVSNDEDGVLNFQCCLANASASGLCVITSKHYKIEISREWTIFGYGNYEVRWGQKVLGDYCMLGLKLIEN